MGIQIKVDLSEN